MPSFAKYLLLISSLFLCLSPTWAQDFPASKTLKKELKQLSKAHRDLIKNPQNTPEAGLFYLGMLAAYESGLKKKYFKALLKVGNELTWQLGNQPVEAGNHLIAQTYLDLYRMSSSPYMYAFYQLAIDSLQSHEGHVNWEQPEDWFQAAPALAKLAGITADTSYLQEVSKGWQELRALHLDRERNLWNSGSPDQLSYPPQATAWIMAGLVRVWQELPPEDSLHLQFAAHFRFQAERLLSLQQSSGYWPEDFSRPTGQKGANPEATVLCAYVLAAGIQTGLLDRDTYLPSLLKAWEVRETDSPETPTQTGIRMLLCREMMAL